MNTETPINNPVMSCAFCATLRNVNSMLIRDDERFCDQRCATSVALMRYADNEAQGVTPDEIHYPDNGPRKMMELIMSHITKSPCDI